jgi:hypothetical protein
MSIGGRFTFNDAGDVPNAQIIYYDFPTAPVLYEVHNLREAKDSNKAPTYRGFRTDTCVQCEGGYAMLRSGQIMDNQGKKIKQFNGGGDHFANFIHALRTGKREDLHADILDGHISTGVCHTGNISYRLGKKASPDEARKQIGDLPQFQKMFDDYLKHLKAHEVDPSESILGPWLTCDVENESIKDNTEANQLVKGTFREPFVVPAVEV